MDNKVLINYFSQFITEDRYELFQRILSNRTRYLTVVLEEIFQAQNASAVLRSADCFGINDIHVIEQRNTFTVDREVAMGSSKWLHIHQYGDEPVSKKEIFARLRAQGYRIVATTPHEGDVELEHFDLAKGKAALIFGTELGGITPEVMDEADEFLKIPMFGFTESLNISVSAAIIMQRLTTKLHESDIRWRLTDNDRDEIMVDWLRRTIRSSEMLEQKFYESQGK